MNNFFALMEKGGEGEDLNDSPQFHVPYIVEYMELGKSFVRLNAQRHVCHL